LAGESGVMLPLAMLVAALEDRLVNGGHGDEDMSVLARAVRELAVPSPAADPASEPAADRAPKPPSDAAPDEPR
jgi:hypothetical protein